MSIQQASAGKEKPFAISWAAARAILVRFGALNNVFFWTPLVIFALLGCILSWFLVSRAAEEERGQMLITVHGRAESLIWAIEGAARFSWHSSHAGLENLFVEMARQPGVAWLALVDANGRILLDSNPQLKGYSLYTPGEMRALTANAQAHGRFSPDDPEIYETWKRFNPGRLRGRHKMEHMREQGDGGKSYIFAALDVRDFKQHLTEYIWHLGLIAGLVILASLAFFVLIFITFILRNSRRKLADARALSAQVIQSYPSSFLVTDISGGITFLNPAARDLFGLKDHKHPGSLADLQCLDWSDLMQELSSGQMIYDREMEVQCQQRATVPVSLTAATILDADGKPSGYLFVFRNLAEVNLLKKKLAQSERLSSMGKLASGLAHEIRNPLSSIRGYASYLESRMDKDPIGKQAANLLVEETQRLNGVLEELLTLAKPPALRLKDESLKSILRKVHLIAMPDAGSKNIELALDFSRVNSSDEKAEVDADRLTQAFLNLLLNAVQATQEGGKAGMILEFISDEESKNSSDKNYLPQTGAYWRVSIWDNGPGMTEKVKSQIFTPYFSTKAKGTGLGLPLCREIVESHGGAIYVNSLPGQGAVFTVLIPAKHIGKV